MNIVIMGATSHIAKGLIDRFLQKGGHYLYLYSRHSHNVKQFLDSIGKGNADGYTICGNYQEFPAFSYDVIINCIGVETRNKHNCDFKRYFSLTEEFDTLALDYLERVNERALYISFSSGAVYGKGFAEPVGENSANSIQVNRLVPEDYYGIVRINAEAKHRAHSNLKIIDLRIFSYFSKYINLTDGYFITDLLEAIINDKVLITDNTNIIRDYLHQNDLFEMILCCINAGKLNCAFDVNSSCPVSKQEILAFFAVAYGLKYEFSHHLNTSSATGTKANYYSTNRDSLKIGFNPQYSSMAALQHGVANILAKRA
jgi:nucleoside-diphosphate-sugar epimerase